jgi:hypothetical protein
VNPAKTGTKAAAHYELEVPAGGSQTVRLRLSAAASNNAFKGFDKTFTSRIADADEFYERITPKSLNEDQCLVHRQALAGMLWSKQYYFYDLEKWLREHKSHPLLDSAREDVRNTEWFHMSTASCDLHARQMGYPVVRGLGPYFPHGFAGAGGFRFREGAVAAHAAEPVLPPERADSAYEWNFSDVNPPARICHALAVQVQSGRWAART